GGLYGWALKKPEVGNDVFIEYEIKNFDSSLHTNVKKRPLNGPDRLKISQRLCDGLQAVNYRREQVRNVENKNRKMYTLEVLRKSRQERKHATQFAEAVPQQVVWMSLLELKFNEKFFNAIHQISLVPFACLYWTRNQILLYSHYLNKEKD